MSLTCTKETKQLTITDNSLHTIHFSYGAPIGAPIGPAAIDRYDKTENVTDNCQWYDMVFKDILKHYFCTFYSYGSPIGNPIGPNIDRYDIEERVFSMTLIDN